MIVLLDIEKQKITFYGKKGMVDIPFTQAGALYDHVDSENVLYITNAIEVNAEDIMNMIRGMGVKIEDDIIQDTGIKYLHGITEGTIYIDETLKFEGPFDCKVIDQQLSQVINVSHILQDLIKNKKIEIIGERRRARLMGNFKQFQVKQLERQQLIDAQLDSIIVNDSVDSMMVGGKVVVGDRGAGVRDHNDIISVDIGSRGRVGSGGDVGPTFNTMSELLGNIEGMEG